MEYAFIILSAVAVVVGVVYAVMASRRKLRQKLERNFGEPPTNHKFVSDSVCAYYTAMSKDSEEHLIDDLTFYDLDMDEVFVRINSCHSSVGEEYLYYLLHKPIFESQILNEREELMRGLSENPDLRMKIQIQLSKLGYSHFNGVSQLLNLKKVKPLRKSFIYNIFALLPVVGFAVCFFHLGTGIQIIALSFVVNVILHYRLKKVTETNLASMRYLSSMLHCAYKMSKFDNEFINSYTSTLKTEYNELRALKKMTSAMSSKGASEFAFFAEYIDIMFLSDIRRYNKFAKTVAQKSENIIRLFETIGELDASIAIISYRKSLDYFCCPTFTTEEGVTAIGIYHPLVEEPVSNDVYLGKSILLTGSNASGKSTFIKAVAVNAILSQTIKTCLAKSFCFAPALVITSMAISDDVSAGDSYFVSEIKSLRRICNKIKEIRCICIIDEILRGTNTTERIAASVSMMKFLKRYDSTCIVASHDIELTEILKSEYENYHFCETMTNDGIYFDYKIKKGASKTKNAIKLLELYDFDKSIIEEANAILSISDEQTQENNHET